MKQHTLIVPTCALDSLLLEPPMCEYGHRGIWFYASDLGIDICPGDVVRFVKDSWRDGKGRERGEVVAAGLVTQLLTPDAYPKFCSRVNDKGFRWQDFVWGTEPGMFRLLHFVRSDDGEIMLATRPEPYAEACDVVYDNLESVPVSAWESVGRCVELMKDVT